MTTNTLVNINILVLDDNPLNIFTMHNILSENFGFIKENMFPHNVEEFSNKIETFSKQHEKSLLREYISSYIIEHEIDLLILDFALTNKEEEKDIEDTSGFSILEEFNNSNKKYLRDLPIVAFSIMKIEEIQRKISTSIVATIPKEARNSTDLSKELYADMSIIYSMVHHGRRYKESRINKYDLAIVCALKLEFDMIKKVLGFTEENDSIYQGSNYTFGKYPIGNTHIKIVIKWMHDMGMVEAATHTTNMINLFQPKYIAMPGICAGINPYDQKLADIVIPEFVWNWQSGKHAVKKEGESNVYTSYFKGNMKQKELSESLKPYAENLVSNKNTIFNEIHLKYKQEFNKGIAEINILKELINNLDNKKKEKKILENSLEEYQNFINLDTINNRNIHYDKMISGSAVVADSDTIKSAVGNESKIYGLDMEIYGVFYAAKKLDVDVIAMKSICDFADNSKNDIFQPYCAYSSAYFLHKLFIDIFNNQ